MEVIDLKTITNKKEFIECARKLYAQVEEMGRILEVNAIAEAKTEINSGLERFYRKPDGSIVFNAISSVGVDRAFECSNHVQEVKPSQRYLDFMASLERGDHLNLNTLSL